MPPCFMLLFDMLLLDIESPFCIEPCCIDEGGDMEVDDADWAKTAPVASRQHIAIEALISGVTRMFLPSMIERRERRGDTWAQRHGSRVPARPGPRPVDYVATPMNGP